MQNEELIEAIKSSKDTQMSPCCVHVRVCVCVCGYIPLLQAVRPAVIDATRKDEIILSKMIYLRRSKQATAPWRVRAKFILVYE